MSLLIGHIDSVTQDPGAFSQWFDVWKSEPFVILIFLSSTFLYYRGVTLWNEVGAHRALKKSNIRFFVLGLFTLFIALLSPLHRLGEKLFCAHMVQHELLMIVAAPLLVLGRSNLVLLRGIGSTYSKSIIRIQKGKWISSILHWTANPFITWLVHAAALWIWHVPFLFQATLESDWVHAAQHASFLGSALLFWHSAFNGPSRKRGYGMAVIYLFTTAIHTGFLGALLTFSHHLFYPIYIRNTVTWGLNPLEDQQLGGLIMWIPPSVIYIGVSLFLFRGWLIESGVRVRTWELKAQCEVENSR